MKGKIIAFIAGIVLATAGTAGAVSTAGFWNKSTSTYDCFGNATYAACKLNGTKLRTSVDRKLGVWVSLGGNVLFGCERYDRTYDCTDYRD